jgi:hypothetical protein
MVSFAISGATTLNGADARAAGVLISPNGGNGGPADVVTNYSGSGTFLVTLNSGTNTFTANYKALGSGAALNATFTTSSITVQVF